ncbi:MAG TPA: G5 domain-containing protein [Anaerolineae bacterium]
MASLQVGQGRSVQREGSAAYGRAPFTAHCPLPTAYCLLLLICTFIAACAPQPPPASQREPIQVRLMIDGDTHTLTTEATTVRELLDEAGVSLAEADEITPPLFTPLEDNMNVTILRVSESLEVITESIPFERKVVRNESMDADDPPVIVQGGKAGLQEVTVRIVYRDGLEAERWPTKVTVVEPAQDEIVMVGIGASRGNVTFAGTLAFMSDGAGVIMRGSTAFPEQLDLGGRLDGRVFTLSPTGSHLLYTRAMTETAGFANSLWVISTERGARPRPLGVENVLWAGWNPAQTDLLQIAYTTAQSTELPPGWEANNDLWLGQVLADEEAAFEPEQLVEAYPALNGWWGGNYAWSPDGRFIATGYANEVSLIVVEPEADGPQRIQLQRFTEYNTLADWVWVPTLSWSPDGRFLAFTNHDSEDPQAMVFSSWVIDTATGIAGRFVEQAGMWGHMHCGPLGAGGQIAFLKATDPLDTLRSTYTLWLMDQDGSNARQIYPPIGENSNFPHDQHFMAWGPGGSDIAFVFNDALYLLNLETNEAQRVTQDDAIISLPTWAPYGLGISGDLPATRAEDLPTPSPTRTKDLLPQD